MEPAPVLLELHGNNNNNNNNIKYNNEYSIPTQMAFRSIPSSSSAAATTTTANCLYRLEENNASDYSAQYGDNDNFTNVFTAEPALMFRLASFCRLPTWGHVLQLNRAWYQAAITHEMVWHRFLTTVFSSVGASTSSRKQEQNDLTHIEGADDTKKLRKQHSWWRTLASTVKRHQRVADENLKLLLASESWAMAACSTTHESMEIVLRTDSGEMVAVSSADCRGDTTSCGNRQPLTLIQTLVENLATIDVLQGLGAGKYRNVQIQRLRLCNRQRIPPLDEWWALEGSPLLTLETNPLDDQQKGTLSPFATSVLRATRRKLKAKYMDIFEILARRCKQQRDKVALACLKRIFHK
jgi:hypothetical protein